MAAPSEKPDPPVPELHRDSMLLRRYSIEDYSYSRLLARLGPARQAASSRAGPGCASRLPLHVVFHVHALCGSALYASVCVPLNQVSRVTN